MVWIHCTLVVEPSDAIWQYSFTSNWAKVMVCLVVTNHFLKKCWLLVNYIPWHSLKSTFTTITHVTIRYTKFVIYNFNIIVISPSSRWSVKIQLQSVRDANPSLLQALWRLLNTHSEIEFPRTMCSHNDTIPEWHTRQWPRLLTWFNFNPSMD